MRGQKQTKAARIAPKPPYVALGCVASRSVASWVQSGVARCVRGAARDLHGFILGCPAITTSFARKYSAKRVESSVAASRLLIPQSRPMLGHFGSAASGVGRHSNKFIGSPAVSTSCPSFGEIGISLTLTSAREASDHHAILRIGHD